ncbi:hypothetical protein [Candidatus Vesicomyidisocius calyptogenae]|uniref:Uncharacterized protein n=1 Tax=Vesicomyosocius okutanii subsp. Calyptogena okutanii (strain HA) TaxID=412965 RepID=A5CVS2_VESOH|nr:hypothetical protein [Candidatus Vesicomyosocius okutanii]BAF61965.1 hypothetical protein COSY_0860 [Candidatus Vesicomyosocius okutanii]
MISNKKQQLKDAIQIARKAEIEALIATEKAQKSVNKIVKLRKELDVQYKKLAKKIKENKKNNDKKIEYFSKKKVKKAKKKKSLK